MNKSSTPNPIVRNISDKEKGGTSERTPNLEEPSPTIKTPQNKDPLHLLQRHWHPLLVKWTHNFRGLKKHSDFELVLIYYLELKSKVTHLKVKNQSKFKWIETPAVVLLTWARARNGYCKNSIGLAVKCWIIILFFMVEFGTRNLISYENLAWHFYVNFLFIFITMIDHCTH
jgi:hypothetical protein